MPYGDREPDQQCNELKKDCTFKITATFPRGIELIHISLDLYRSSVADKDT